MAVRWTARRCRALGSWRRPALDAEAGFLLPLSLGAALVLLLTSLSVQTAALHGNHLAAAELEQRQRQDALDSAAQRVAAQLSGDHACLLPVASAAWIQPVPGCPSDLDPAPLLTGQVSGENYRLLEWRPPAETVAGAGREGTLRLELDGTGAGGSRRYALAVALVEPAMPVLHVVSVRGMGR